MESPSETPFLVVGPPGAGKSTMLQALAEKGKLVGRAESVSLPSGEVRCRIGSQDLLEISRPSLKEARQAFPRSPAGVLFVASAVGGSLEEAMGGLKDLFPGVPAVVLLNKVDCATSREIGVLKSQARSVLPWIEVIEVSAKEGFGLDAVLKHVGQKTTAAASPGEIAPETRVEMSRRRLAGSVSEFFMHIERVPRVLLVGASGSGKSRLFNALLGRNEAKVSAKANTTRDVQLGDVHGLKVIDTPALPGIETLREKADEILPDTDLVVYVVNALGRLTDQDHEVIQWLDSRGELVVVLNKLDALNEADRGNILLALEGSFAGTRLKPIPVSSKSGEGMERLLDVIQDRLHQYVVEFERRSRLKPEPPRPGPSAGPGATAAAAGPSTIAGVDADTVLIFSYATLATVAVAVLGSLRLPIPFLNLATVVYIQYLLLGRLVRKSFPEPQIHRPLQIAGTVLGGMAFFALAGKIPFIVGRVLDACLAFASTAAVGYLTVTLGRTLDQYLPTWVRKLLFRSIDPKDPGR